MKIVFSDNQSIELAINNNSLGNTYLKIYKHLSSLPIPWKGWDNPYYLDNISYVELVNNLILYGKKLFIDVDFNQCLIQNQEHFNHLHKIYEKNYNGDPKWLDFHEHIHMCENYYNKNKKKYLHIDYREKSGLLERKIDSEWLLSLQTKISAGDVFVRWAELSKNPYDYWKNNEPNDIKRICQLAKPWLKLKPKIMIALEDIDTLANKDKINFKQWWSKYHDTWCNHWGIPKWDVDDMFGVTVFGKVYQLEELKKCLLASATPVRVAL